jgi:hypothetical protein
MKLWILRPVNVDDWGHLYDIAAGFIVRAQTPEEARQIVAYSGATGDETAAAWQNPNSTTCDMLGYSLSVQPGIVMRDFRAG